jgi:hypothetical protein
MITLEDLWLRPVFLVIRKYHSETGMLEKVPPESVP